MPSAPGYSGKPVAAKLGLKPGMAMIVVGLEADYAALIGPLPDGIMLMPEIRRSGQASFMCSRRSGRFLPAILRIGARVSPAMR